MNIQAFKLSLFFLCQWWNDLTDQYWIIKDCDDSIRDSAASFESFEGLPDEADWSSIDDFSEAMPAAAEKNTNEEQSRGVNNNDQLLP